jgi:hypothetical protein
MRHDDQNAEQLRRLRARDWAEEDEMCGAFKGIARVCLFYAALGGLCVIVWQLMILWQ